MKKNTSKEMIDKSIFRSYDIRGKVGEKLTTGAAYNIGFHLGKLVISKGNNRVVVGFDGRLSTPSLFDALVTGFVDSGVEVTSIGLVPSPVLYFADRKLHPGASVMITGSHNDKHDNGFKILVGGKSFFGEHIEDLRKTIFNNHKTNYEIRSDAKIIRVNVRPFYIEKILQNININPELKIVWDPGNGSSAGILKEALEKMPNENYVIHEEIDGNFPNHHPDPTIPENLQQLMEAVKEKDADFGIAFDGDGDRIGVVTKEGRILFGDQLLCIYSKEILSRKPGSIIIADVKASKTLFDYIESLGGRALMWKTGHSHIKTKMIETSAEIAGEMSGHIFFSDGYYGYDDALYAALRLIDCITKSGKSLDEIYQELPKAYNTPEIRLEVDDAIKFQIVESVRTKAKMLGLNYIDVDGIRANLEFGWWLIRASNTQAALIVRAEADDDKSLKMVIKDLNSILKEFDLEVKY